MCMAEYNGTWVPYKVPLHEVTFEWLMKEMTYDDCNRKDEIAKYVIEKFNEMQRKVFDYEKLRHNLAFIMKSVNELEDQNELEP